MIYQVSVKTGQKRESVEILADNQIVVKTTKHPVDGEANQAVINLLSKHFHIAKGNIKILKGQTKKTKLIEIHML